MLLPQTRQKNINDIFLELIKIQDQIFGLKEKKSTGIQI